MIADRKTHTDIQTRSSQYSAQYSYRWRSNEQIDLGADVAATLIFILYFEVQKSALGEMPH